MTNKVLPEITRELQENQEKILRIVEEAGLMVIDLMVIIPEVLRTMEIEIAETDIANQITNLMLL
jgi:hypothetical protein